jgi:hypothetical protein
MSFMTAKVEVKPTWLFGYAARCCEKLIAARKIVWKGFCDLLAYLVKTLFGMNK